MLVVIGIVYFFISFFVVLIRLVLYRDLFMLWFVVVMKVFVILLLIISWLVIFDSDLSIVSLVDIFELLMIVIIGWVGLFIVLFSVLSLLVSRGFVYVIGVNILILWVEVWVWCVVLNVFIMNMLYSVVYFLDSVFLFFFLFLLKWMFFRIISLFVFSLMLFR